MSKKIVAAKRKFISACKKQVRGELSYLDFRCAVQSFENSVFNETCCVDPQRRRWLEWAESTRAKLGVSRYAEFA